VNALMIGFLKSKFAVAQCMWAMPEALFSAAAGRAVAPVVRAIGDELDLVDVVAGLSVAPPAMEDTQHYIVFQVVNSHPEKAKVNRPGHFEVSRCLVTVLVGSDKG
jgi:hypothetical protein